MTERARDSTISEAMDVDTSATVNRKGKQKAEEERPAETAEGKKPRLGKSFLPSFVQASIYNVFRNSISSPETV
jgi:squamous cell carcinoma antigen recognized by T-cells 3